MLKINSIESNKIYHAAFDKNINFGNRIPDNSPLRKVLTVANCQQNPIVLIINKFNNNPERLKKELGNFFTTQKDHACLYLYNLVKAFDANTAKHSKGVSDVASGFAKFIGMSNYEVNEIEKAGLLHDIGKLFVPHYIPNKPGSLTDQEYAIIKKHPKLGKIFLDEIGFSKINSLFKKVSFLVEHHHNYNKKDCISYKPIRQKVEILRLADVYSALTEKYRPYNKPLSPEKALEKMYLKMNEDNNIWSPEMFEQFKSFVNKKLVPERKHIQVVA